MACKRPESVLVLIYTAAGEVLQMERRRPDGFWQSVTGSLEEGESPRNAAIREVREETGLDVAAALVDCHATNRFEILPAWRSRYAPDVHWNVEHVFRVEYSARPQVRIEFREHKRAEWLPATEALARASSYTDRAAIKRYVSD